MRIADSDPHLPTVSRDRSPDVEVELVVRVHDGSSEFDHPHRFCWHATRTRSGDEPQPDTYRAVRLAIGDVAADAMAFVDRAYPGPRP